MLLTIQIVNYNSRENLEACLRSIEGCFPDWENIQVIVINNDKEKLEKFPNAFKTEIIEKNENIGFGKAHNLGFRAAKGDFVLFLNPDVKVFPETISRLMEAFSSDSKIGIVGPIHVGEDDFSKEECFGARKTPLSTIGAKISPKKKEPLAENVFEADWVSGGAMMIRRELFSEVSGFDENFFMYFEDVDLCLRAKESGWKVIVHPRARIFHKSGQSFSNNRQKKKYYYASQSYYVKKNFGAPWVLMMKILRLPLYIKNVYFNK